MAENKLADEVASKTMGVVANHPRLIASLAVMVVMIALSGGAVAESSDVDTGP
ncbi:MAG: hypothetical protein ABEJ79_01990 [Halolamina sp.]